VFAICKGPLSALINRLSLLHKAPNCFKLSFPQATITDGLLAFISWAKERSFSAPVIIILQDNSSVIL